MLEIKRFEEQAGFGVQKFGHALLQAITLGFVTSLRMQAIMATSKTLPAAMSRWAMGAMMGLNRMAASVAMYKAVRSRVG